MGEASALFQPSTLFNQSLRRIKLSLTQTLGRVIIYSETSDYVDDTPAFLRRKRGGLKVLCNTLFIFPFTFTGLGLKIPSKEYYQVDSETGNSNPKYNLRSLYTYLPKSIVDQLRESYVTDFTPASAQLVDLFVFVKILHELIEYRNTWFSCDFSFYSLKSTSNYYKPDFIKTLEDGKRQIILSRKRRWASQNQWEPNWYFLCRRLEDRGKEAISKYYEVWASAILGHQILSLHENGPGQKLFLFPKLPDKVKKKMVDCKLYFGANLSDFNLENSVFQHYFIRQEETRVATRLTVPCNHRAHCRCCGYLIPWWLEF